jgi:hypothetical protein
MTILHKQVRFGKHAPKHDYRTFRFPSYSAALPTPADAFENLDHVFAALKTSDVSKLFPMDGNDVEGCCTIAGAAHLISLWSGLIGKHKLPTAKSVHRIYRHLSGGEDTGLNMLDVLNYWRKTSIDRDKILAFAKVNSHNHTHVKQAIQFFGGVYVGFQCQENVIDDFNAHKPWAPGKLTEDGHAIAVTGFDSKQVNVLTWGDTQKGTWDWWDECVDEAYVILPPEAKHTGFAPGFDFETLEADLASVTG